MGVLNGFAQTALEKPTQQQQCGMLPLCKWSDNSAALRHACSKPYSGFSASMAGVSRFSSSARVLVACGVLSGLYTLHSTSTSSPAADWVRVHRGWPAWDTRRAGFRV